MSTNKTISDKSANKAIKDKIKQACRLFPEFDVQGFRLICKICNTPLKIITTTRIADLSEHFEEERHKSCMGSDKKLTRSRVAANRVQQQSTLSQSSQNNISINRPSSQPDKTPVSSFPVTVTVISSSSSSSSSSSLSSSLTSSMSSSSSSSFAPTLGRSLFITQDSSPVEGDVYDDSSQSVISITQDNKESTQVHKSLEMENEALNDQHSDAIPLPAPPTIETPNDDLPFNSSDDITPSSLVEENTSCNSQVAEELTKDRCNSSPLHSANPCDLNLDYCVTSDTITMPSVNNQQQPVTGNDDVENHGDAENKSTSVSQNGKGAVLETVSSETSDQPGARAASLRKRRRDSAKEQTHTTPTKSAKSKGNKKCAGLFDENDEQSGSRGSAVKRNNVRKKKVVPYPDYSDVLTMQQNTSETITPVASETTNDHPSLPQLAVNDSNSIDAILDEVIKSEALCPDVLKPTEIRKSVDRRDSAAENRSFPGNDGSNGFHIDTTNTKGGHLNNNVNINSDNTSDNQNSAPQNGRVKVEKENDVNCEYENEEKLTKIETRSLTIKMTDFLPLNEPLCTDLIEMCLNGNISFSKLTGSAWRSFFAKHFGANLPSAEKMRIHVLRPMYDVKIGKLKELVADHHIYLILKEHWNDDRGHIVTILVGILNGQPYKPYLFKLSVMQNIDLTVLSQEIIATLHSLYNCLPFDKLSVLVTENTDLMLKIGNFLKTLFPSLKHIHCVFQIFDSLCESFRLEHKHMRHYASSVADLFAKCPKLLKQFKQQSVTPMEAPINQSDLNGYQWMYVIATYFAEAPLMVEIMNSLEEPISTQYIAALSELMENKDLVLEKIDFNGYRCLLEAIKFMKKTCLSLPQMKMIIDGIGRHPKRSNLIQRVKETIYANHDLVGLLEMGQKMIDYPDERDSKLEMFKYTPLSTIDSFKCYNEFQSILEENNGCLVDSELETLTFLAFNKDL